MERNVSAFAAPVNDPSAQRDHITLAACKAVEIRTIFLLVNDRHARSGRAVVISFTQYPKGNDIASAPHAESHHTEEGNHN
jgi:hypothetical protein